MTLDPVRIPTSKELLDWWFSLGLPATRDSLPQEWDVTTLHDAIVCTHPGRPRDAYLVRSRTVVHFDQVHETGEEVYDSLGPIPPNSELSLQVRLSHRYR